MHCAPQREGALVYETNSLLRRDIREPCAATFPATASAGLSSPPHVHRPPLPPPHIRASRGVAACRARGTASSILFLSSHNDGRRHPSLLPRSRSRSRPPPTVVRRAPSAAAVLRGLAAAAPTVVVEQDRLASYSVASSRASHPPAARGALLAERRRARGDGARRREVRVVLRLVLRALDRVHRLRGDALLVPEARRQDLVLHAAVLVLVRDLAHLQGGGGGLEDVAFRATRRGRARTMSRGGPRAGAFVRTIRAGEEGRGGERRRARSICLSFRLFCLALGRSVCLGLPYPAGSLALALAFALARSSSTVSLPRRRGPRRAWSARSRACGTSRSRPRGRSRRPPGAGWARS